jgi:hypothetical protein
MLEPNRDPRPSSSVRRPVLLGLFAGTAVGGGHLLAAVPNVEVMSLITAIAGIVLGPGLGFACGALAAGIYSLSTPIGLPTPPLLAAQMVGMGCAGLLGPLAAGSRGRGPTRSPAWAMVRAGAGGLVVTVIFDLLTNLASLATFDMPIGVLLVGAIPFFAIHAGSNIVIFAALLPVLARRLGPLARPRLGGHQGSLPAAACLGLGLGLGALVAAVPARAQEPVPVIAPADTMQAAVAAPADSTATAAAATTAATPATATSTAAAPAPTGPHGWRRALWNPFDPTYLAWAERRSPWLAYADGGTGAQARLVGEAGTSAMPLVVRDGVPLGTGHVLADDVWLVGIEGSVITASGLGADGWGGTGGLVTLTARDDEPARAISSYRGIKGRHESYYRGVDFLTPRADWRLRFDFEESLDNEGYNHTTLADDAFADRRVDQFAGQGKVRQNRTLVSRAFPDGSELSVEVGAGRRTRDDLPSLGAGSLESWDRTAAVRMRWLRGAWDLRPVVYWVERDVAWAPRPEGLGAALDMRLLETGRQGVRLDVRRRTASADTAAADSTLAHAPVRSNEGTMPLLSLSAQGWTLRDTGTTAAWAAGDTLSVAGRGDELRAALGWDGRLGGARALAQAGALWSRAQGAGPDAAFSLAEAADVPRWQLGLEWGGRAPRSDELLTPLRQVVAGASRALLPNGDLDREQTLRATLVTSIRLSGLDLAVGASGRRLRGGIAWRADPLDEAPDPATGRWANDLDLTAWRLDARLARAGRFMGWARLSAEGTWQGFDVTSGQTALPPGQWQRLRVDWENHLFQEDGILQVSLLTTRRAEAADPWDVTGQWQLPARINHDLLLGFRLTGAHLTLGIRNLAGTRQQLASGALSPGQELDMRLEWGFHQ